MATHNGPPLSIGMINSMWGEMPLPSKNTLQKFCGDLLTKITKLYNSWVMKGYVSKEEYFSEMYSEQLEEAIRIAKRYRVARDIHRQFNDRATDGNKIIGGVAIK